MKNRSERDQFQSSFVCGTSGPIADTNTPAWSSSFVHGTFHPTHASWIWRHSVGLVCGAVGAALKGKDQPSDNLKQLISLIHTGDDLPKDKAAALDAAIRNNVRHQAQLLSKQSRIIQDFAGSGRVKIAPAVYDLKTGVVSWLELPKK